MAELLPGYLVVGSDELKSVSSVSNAALSASLY